MLLRLDKRPRRTDPSSYATNEPVAGLSILLTDQDLPNCFGQFQVRLGRSSRVVFRESRDCTGYFEVLGDLGLGGVRDGKVRFLSRPERSLGDQGLSSLCAANCKADATREHVLTQGSRDTIQPPRLG